MTTPVEALKAAIEAHNAIAEASRTAAADVAAEREKTAAAEKAAAALNVKAPVA